MALCGYSLILSWRTWLCGMVLAWHAQSLLQSLVPHSQAVLTSNPREVEVGGLDVSGHFELHATQLVPAHFGLQEILSQETKKN